MCDSSSSGHCLTYRIIIRHRCLRLSCHRCRFLPRVTFSFPTRSAYPPVEPAWRQPVSVCRCVPTPARVKLTSVDSTDEARWLNNAKSTSRCTIPTLCYHYVDQKWSTGQGPPSCSTNSAAYAAHRLHQMFVLVSFSGYVC